MFWETSPSYNALDVSASKTKVSFNLDAPFDVPVDLALKYLDFYALCTNDFISLVI